MYNGERELSSKAHHSLMWEIAMVQKYGINILPPLSLTHDVDKILPISVCQLYKGKTNSIAKWNGAESFYCTHRISPQQWKTHKRVSDKKGMCDIGPCLVGGWWDETLDSLEKFLGSCSWQWYSRKFAESANKHALSSIAWISTRLCATIIASCWITSLRSPDGGQYLAHLF